MDEMTSDDDGDVPDQLSVADPVLGKTRLLARPCGTCIFLPGNRMHLSPGRLRELVNQARRDRGYIICHITLPYYEPGAELAICRGFVDRYRTWQLQVIERLWGFVEVEPPPHTGPPTTPAAHPPPSRSFRKCQ